MSVEDLINPLEYYNSYLKDKVNDAACKYFDNLVTITNTDKDANKTTCDKYYKKEEELNTINDLINSKKGLKGFLIFLSVLLFVLAFTIGILLFKNIFSYPELHIGFILLFIAIGLVILLVFVNRITEYINEQEKIRDEIINVMKTLKDEAYHQLIEINTSYDDNCANEIINSCIDLIKFDRSFKPEKLCKLKYQYGFMENTDKDTSTLSLQSGEILGNPFLLYKQLHTFMGSQTYTGSITISWQEQERDNEGHTHYVTKMETLYASITRPKPFYTTSTHLVYGNDAAPNLSFSRTASKANEMDEKDFEKLERKFDKKLDKMVQKDIDPSDGSQFTRLANAEFEGLFNALNRDNELEFRLLFTPIAQNNELKLIKSKVPYGDDFSFVKNHKLNFITSSHSQIFNYDCNPSLFIGFDLEKSRTKFIAYINNYLKGFYFDLAPLLCIPLYQQTKTRDYIYNNDYPSNITSLEHEVIANAFNDNLLKPMNCDTDIINKVKFNGKAGNIDDLTVKSTGYETFDEVEYVSEMGGDGHMHSIPVHWTRYEQVSTIHKIQGVNTNMSRKEYYSNNTTDNSSIIIKKGLLGVLGRKFNDLGIKINK